MPKSCQENLNKNTLAYAKTFLFYKIFSIENLDFRLLRRLAELGFLPNAKLKIIRKSGKNKTFLVAINNFVVSIRRDLAENIRVERV